MMKDKKLLEKQLEECQKMCEEYLNGWKRAQADFVNYKKEEGKRAERITEVAQEELLRELLPILDTFDIAEESISEEMRNDQSVHGILQTKKQLLDFLKQYNIVPLEVVGTSFDPLLHEAVEMIATDEEEEGIILEEVQKGYMINERVLRPAKVKIVQ